MVTKRLGKFLTMFYRCSTVLQILSCHLLGFYVAFCDDCYPEYHHLGPWIEFGMTQKHDTFSHMWQIKLKNMTVKAYNTTDHRTYCFWLFGCRICSETL